MIDVVLFQPEIPPNTGNVIRLCANTGARLHLVRPLGFSMDDRQLRRAGLDYHEMARVHVHEDWTSCLAALGPRRVFALSARGEVRHCDVEYREDDVVVAGPETAGLAPEFLESFPPERRLRIPMRPGNRSLNLSNAVAVVVFEAWRQHGFAGAQATRAADRG
jgi:tRNA (cytidine/uridine-2'-O-)-methyltransferase